MLFAELTLAAGDNPFAKAEEKGQSFLDFLQGRFAIILGTIALVVAFLALLMGRISKERFIQIAIAIIGISIAGTLVEWGMK